MKTDQRDEIGVTPHVENDRCVALPAFQQAFQQQSCLPCDPYALLEPQRAFRGVSTLATSDDSTSSLKLDYVNQRGKLIGVCTLMLKGVATDRCESHPSNS